MQIGEIHLYKNIIPNLRPLRRAGIIPSFHHSKFIGVRYKYN